MRYEEVIGVVSGISFAYVVAVLFVAYIARRLESKLVVMGLLTAVASVAFGTLVGGPSIHLSEPGMSAQMSGGASATGGSLAEMMMRLGVILCLAGIGVGCSSRCHPASPPLPPETRSPQP